MKTSPKPLAVLALSMSVLLPVVSLAGDDVSTVNKSIRIDRDSSAGSVESVNGSIRVGDGAVLESVESVNGAIDIGKDVQVERDVESVNGAVRLDRGSVVGGSVETVNGKIELQDTDVAGDVESVNGGLRLLDATVVDGDVRVRKPQGWSNNRNRPVKVEIGKDVQVHGDLIFEHPVELRLHESARVGEVIGDEVTLMER